MLQKKGFLNCIYIYTLEKPALYNVNVENYYNNFPDKCNNYVSPEPPLQYSIIQVVGAIAFFAE